MAKSGAVTPTGLGMVTENTPELHPESLKMASPIKEGLGSLNRWSQSTASSKSPSDYTGHRRGSSKMSISGHSPHRAPGLGELPELSLPEFRASNMFPTDPTTSHLDLSLAASSHIFQNSADELRDSAPSYQPDYMVARASEGASSLVDGEGEPDRQHGQTQKAMLSKALQKANTAVLLDNAANFEGAMEAYTDACQLLQLVMLRSNGGDEEKLKLQEIVRNPFQRQNEFF
jgi:MIT (microtubule interacting and transport) domain.